VMLFAWWRSILRVAEVPVEERINQNQTNTCHKKDCSTLFICDGRVMVITIMSLLYREIMRHVDIQSS
jgi:hypothetical protein